VRFSDTVVVVTGAASGIGFATAQRFAADGAQVVICDLDTKRVDSAVERIAEDGHEAFGVIADVSQRAEVAAGVDRVMERFGRVDILVNNAGIHVSAPARELTEDHWRRELDVCLTGSFLCAQAVAVASMIPRRQGAIVNVGSGAALAAIPNAASYVAAKHGVVGLTKALAADWAQYRIRVNCVCPGFTWTEVTKGVVEANPDAMRQLIERIPYGGGGQPENIAAVIAFLASPDSGVMTGSVVPVDGATSALSSAYLATRDDRAQ
jgi:NAD(P)-dependent dehydrogenase (short-subunit alcohol dehydrogenase family)